ncbi:hypothetical protein AGDE_00595 [Angomonas deanei]|nr:hypothetical protein AGDE_02661 [Angomonas deanei]EPY43327.1 hypothetical protein AGDE_00595 [Angomonas deanei]|eukprot:EPY41264.1 hypothetical protein AGDE_02661 [Angomonas deanei]
MSLDIMLHVRAANAPASNAPLMVRLLLPKGFPQQQLSLYLLQVDANLKIKQPYPVMSADGNIQLECLSFLRGTERPYPLLDILVAVTEQFELEYPFVDKNYRPPPQQKSSEVNMTNLVNNKRKEQLVQEAAEKVVIDLNEKASTYLQTREESLSYLKKLNDINRDLKKADGMLTKHEAELKSYLPNVGNVQSLMKTLDGYEDSVEEHNRCLTAEDPLHARALDLMAELHASEDTLRLLEDGLKAEQLNCEDFVKCVSDVGREQFVTRFLWIRVCDSIPQLSSIPTTADGTAPSIPQRLNAQAVLSSEFPSAPPDVIADVLRNTNNDVGRSRQELKSMFS